MIFHTRGKWIDNNINIFHDCYGEPGHNNPTLINKLKRIYNSNPLLGTRSYNCEECTLTNTDLLMIKSKIFAQNLTNLCSALIELRTSFPPSALKTLYYSLSHFHLSYCKAKPSCASNPTCSQFSKITRSLTAPVTLILPPLLSA
jgi:hypothetical protein